MSLSRTTSAPKASIDSAQSPAWRRNASPRATLASWSDSWRHSPGNTSGAWPVSCLRTRSRWASSGHSGCWPAARERHEDGDQVVLTSKAWRLGALRANPDRHGDHVGAFQPSTVNLLPKGTRVPS